MLAFWKTRTLARVLLYDKNTMFTSLLYQSRDNLISKLFFNLFKQYQLEPITDAGFLGIYSQVIPSNNISKQGKAPISTDM